MEKMAGSLNHCLACSSGLREHLVLRFGLGPGRRGELFDPGDLGAGQACEQIPHVIEWIEAVPPTTAQQRVD